MISLLIDTSVNRLIIGVYKNNKQLYIYNDCSDNDLSRKVLPKINEILSSLSINVNQIDNIYIVNGPGSFTGIRIGTTIAKTWAYSLGKKIYSISELKLMATSNTDKKYIVPMIDARRGYVYAGMYDSNLNSTINDKYVEKQVLLDEIKRNYSLEDVFFVSYDNLDNCNFPNINVEKILSLSNLKESNPHNINPNYLKKTEAEERLNDKKNN